MEQGYHQFRKTQLSRDHNLMTFADIDVVKKISSEFFCQIDGLRLRAIGRIKTLTILNGQAVTEQESAAALRMAAGSRISQVMGLLYL